MPISLVSGRIFDHVMMKGCKHHFLFRKGSIRKSRGYMPYVERQGVRN